MVPDEYRQGCADPPLQVGARSKTNALSLAAGYGKCAGLQSDTVTWTVCYLEDLAGRKPSKACKRLLGK